MSKVSYLKSILVVALVLIVVSIGYEGWKNSGYSSSRLKNANNTLEDIENVRIKLLTESNQKIPEVDISHWKTYRNAKYKFELKYPQDWFLSKIDEQTGYISITDHDTSYEGDPRLLGRGGVFGAKIEISVLDVQILKKQGIFDDVMKCAKGDEYTIVIACEDIVINGTTYKRQVLKSEVEGSSQSIALITEIYGHIYIITGGAPIDHDGLLRKIEK